MKAARLALLAILLFAGRNSAAAPTPDEPDKAGYDLFHPVPDDLLREVDTDRPDKTNSPHTLDAGHFQIEIGLGAFTQDTDPDIATETWTWADMDLRVGLTNWAELQLEIPAYQSARERDRASHETERSSGFGDITVVLKTAFWGNDQGDTAGGMELFVKTPTAAHGLGNGEVEGGAIFLLGLALPGDFDLGINDGLGIGANDDGGRHADIVNSISVSHQIVGPLSGYVELFSSVPTHDAGDWDGTVDVGSTLTIGRDFQIDAGLNVGITRGADDLEPFVGASYRF